MSLKTIVTSLLILGSSTAALASPVHVEASWNAQIGASWNRGPVVRDHRSESQSYTPTYAPPAYTGAWYSTPTYQVPTYTVDARSRHHRGHEQPSFQPEYFTLASNVQFNTMNPTVQLNYQGGPVSAIRIDQSAALNITEIAIRYGVGETILPVRNVDRMFRRGEPIIIQLPERAAIWNISLKAESTFDPGNIYAARGHNIGSFTVSAAK